MAFSKAICYIDTLRYAKVYILPLLYIDCGFMNKLQFKTKEEENEYIKQMFKRIRDNAFNGNAIEIGG